MGTVANVAHREPWNKGKIVVQKAPFKLRDIWAEGVPHRRPTPYVRPTPGVQRQTRGKVQRC